MHVSIKVSESFPDINFFLPLAIPNKKTRISPVFSSYVVCSSSSSVSHFFFVQNRSWWRRRAWWENWKKKFCELNKNNRRGFLHGRGKKFLLIHWISAFLACFYIYKCNILFILHTHAYTCTKYKLKYMRIRRLYMIYNFTLTTYFGKFTHLLDIALFVHDTDFGYGLSWYYISEVKKRETTYYNFYTR